MHSELVFFFCCFNFRSVLLFIYSIKNRYANITKTIYTKVNVGLLPFYTSVMLDAGCWLLPFEGKEKRRKNEENSKK
jgi:hypothetical protein